MPPPPPAPLSSMETLNPQQYATFSPWNLSGTVQRGGGIGCKEMDKIFDTADRETDRKTDMDEGFALKALGTRGNENQRHLTNIFDRKLHLREDILILHLTKNLGLQRLTNFKNLRIASLLTLIHVYFPLKESGPRR